VGGVIADVRPRRVILIHCDAKVQQVDEASSLDELAHLRVKGSPGGGGTSFIPPFEYLREQGIRPETLIYLTDLMGTFPEDPGYPVVWAATTDADVPFGEVVRIKL
jgi:predicted metal-dependent peptidase